MDLIFPHALHTRVWRHLVNNPGMQKTEAVMQMRSFALLTDDEAALFFVGNHACLGCLYGNMAIGQSGAEYCTKCPFVTTAQEPMECLDRVFNSWCRYTFSLVHDTYGELNIDHDECVTLCAMYARIIADWPVRKNVVCGTAEDLINMNDTLKRDVEKVIHEIRKESVEIVDEIN